MSNNITYEYYLENRENFGYHCGNLKEKAERLTDRGFIIGTTGLMGTGHYFFGQYEQAKNLSERIFRKKIGAYDILAVDFTKFNMFKPKDANEFYDGLIIPMNDYIKRFTLKDLLDEEIIATLDDMADFYRYCGVEISNQDFFSIVETFVKELIFKKTISNEMLNTRVLKKAGFEGVDVRGTNLDDFAVGSIIFNDIPKEYILNLTDYETQQNNISY